MRKLYYLENREFITMLPNNFAFLNRREIIISPLASYSILQLKDYFDSECYECYYKKKTEILIYSQHLLLNIFFKAIILFNGW
jgi:hypothetical protein